MREALYNDVSHSTHVVDARGNGSRDAQVLAALCAIGTALSSNLHLDAVLREVLDAATSLFGARKGSIMLLDDERRVLTIASARGLDPDVVERACVPVGRGISGWVAQTGRPRVVADGVRDELSYVETQNREAAICVPLRTRDRVIGTLNVSGPLAGGGFADADLDLAMMLASQAAVAIVNARLHEAQEQKLRELSALYEVGHALISSLERDETLRVVLRCAIELLGARHGSLMLLDETAQSLEIVAAEGLPPMVVREARPRIGEGIAGQVALTGEPILLRLGQRHEDSESAAGTAPAAVCVPIRRSEKVIGVLNVRDRVAGGNFARGDLQLLLHLSSQAAVAIDNATLHQNVRDLFMGTVRALANAIDARDTYTEKHSERVAALSVAIARRLGLSEERLEALQIAALLHDIGKISINDHILRKPDPLTDDEFAIMKEHPVTGARIVGQVAQLEPVVPFVYHHHEQYARSGYPAGIQGENIPLEARIMAVADAFDAMTSDRPYRTSLPREEAIRKVRRAAGTQLDPQVVETFLQLVETGEVDACLESA